MLEGKTEGELRGLDHSLLDALPDAVLLVDADGMIVAINAQAEVMFGWSRVEIRRQSIDRLVPESWRRAHFERRASFRAAPSVRLMGGGNPLRALRRDGIEIDVEVALAPYELDGRRLVVASVRDCSERLLAASQQKKLEDELRHAQKMECVGRLAGGVAHDFNNLLSVVLGTTSVLLEEHRNPEPLVDDLRAIDHAARRAAELTKQLLAFSRKQVLNPQVLALNAFVREMTEVLRRVIDENIQIQMVLASDAGLTRVDPGQLEQVVLNLAINARDAMPGGGKLTLETRNVELGATDVAAWDDVAPGSYVMLMVSDTGSGMNALTLAQIFEPFFTTKEPGKGTGLGLSTAHGIVQQSGGHIRARSELGIGTTFDILLPRVTARPASVRPGATSIGPANGERTVVLVEDEEFVRAATRRMLTSAGYAVLETGDPEQALALAATHSGPIDLLLADIVMPKMSGPELARRIADICPGIHVLYMSGYPDSAVPKDAIQAARSAFVQKPLSLETLKRRLSHLLSEVRPAASEASG